MPSRRLRGKVCAREVTRAIVLKPSPTCEHLVTPGCPKLFTRGGSGRQNDLADVLPLLDEAVGIRRTVERE